MSLSKKEFTIGRNQGLSDIVVNSETASDRHAKVTLMDDGILLLEDLRSSNGTYVNGERIRTKAIDLTDKIKIGDKEILLRDHFRTENGLVKSFRPANDFTEEFAQLQPIFQAYQAAKDKIKSQQSMSRFMRSTVPLVTPLVGLIISAFIADKDNPFMSALPTIVAVVLGLGFAWVLDSPKTQKIREEKMAQIDAEHRRKFTCPKCQRPFERASSWDIVAAQKTHNCGAILSK